MFVVMCDSKWLVVVLLRLSSCIVWLLVICSVINLLVGVIICVGVVGLLCIGLLDRVVVLISFVINR